MFRPWIGNHYGDPQNRFGGRRVMVVGESHYSAEHQIGDYAPEMTQDVMALYGQRRPGDTWVRTFDNVAWAVAGQNRWELERDGQRGEMAVWEHLALYNYIPVVLANGPMAERPSAELFKLGQASFAQVLSAHDPDVLIVCGLELFPWLIRNHHPDPTIRPWDFKGEWVDLPLTKRVRAIRMKHPSKYFSHRQWAAVIARALAT